jgi:hypothetical protein
MFLAVVRTRAVKGMGLRAVIDLTSLLLMTAISASGDDVACVSASAAGEAVIRAARGRLRAFARISCFSNMPLFCNEKMPHILAVRQRGDSRVSHVAKSRQHRAQIQPKPAALSRQIRDQAAHPAGTNGSDPSWENAEALLGRCLHQCPQFAIECL